MIKHFTKSFTASSDGEILRIFYTSSWQRSNSPIPMLVLRFLETLITLMILVWSVVEAPVPQWPIYLTTWGMILVFAMAASGIVVSICAVLMTIPEVGEPPWYITTYWVFYNITVSMAILITLLYWRLLSKDTSRFPIHHRLFWLETSVHGLNSVLVLLEFFVSRTPVRLAHIYQPILLGLVYAGFSKIYQEAGGTNVNGDPYIYKILDWNDPQATFTMTIGSMIILIFIYVMLWAVALARDALSNVCCVKARPLSKRSESDFHASETKGNVEVGSVGKCYEPQVKDPKVKTTQFVIS